MARFLISAVLYGYYLLLLKTCRFTRVGWENVEEDLRAGRGLVLATVHSVLLPAIASFDGWPGTLIASQSKDGEIISRILERRGYEMVRGSSSRGGKAALKSLLSAVRRGRVVGVTFDGPRGPPCVPKPGVGLLAWEAGNVCWFARIHVVARRVPLMGPTSFSLRLGSWDRFLLPLPFCHLSVVFERVEVDVPHKERHAWIDAFLASLETRARHAYADIYDAGGKERAPSQRLTRRR